MTARIVRWRTLVVAWALFGIAATSAARQLEANLAGYRYMVIAPPEYADGSVDRMGLAAYMADLLRRQDWTLVSATEIEERLATDVELASQVVFCSLGHDARGLAGTSAHFACVDASGVEVFSRSEYGTGFTHKGEIEGALREIAAALRGLRPSFDASKSVDILDRYSDVERRSVTEATIDELIARGAMTDPIEGVWASTNSSGYKLGILAVDAGDFEAVVLQARAILWRPGMVKARFTRTASRRTYLVDWGMADRTQESGIATLDGAVLSTEIAGTVVDLVKLKPAGPRAVAVGDDVRASGTGTGFVVGPGIVATNYHVVEGADRVEMFLPPLERTVSLVMAVFDSVNDLALLRVSDGETSELPAPLGLGDSSQIKLGTDAHVIGFPLGAALNVDHKVTSGVVSAIDGANGDFRMLQFTAPVQPGSSGSPVFDPTGRVIGVVTSTLDLRAALEQGGQVPQNVNFALKSDYIMPLLRRVSTSASTPNQEAEMSLTDLVSQKRAAVGLIRAYRSGR